jgi:hypothetical protein
MRWTMQQVLGLAPDAASVSAARGQASPARWSATGASDVAVWGFCQGSARYQVCVELAGPAYRCTCPSRKIPCKHVLALLLMWSQGAVPDGVVPDWVQAWLTDRAVRVTRREPGTGERDEAAAAKRAARREDRVAAGVAELDGWLTDQVRRGLGTLERGGSAEFAAVAARMVDSQASGLAGGLRRAGELAGRGRDWPGRVLQELALLHLLVRAHGRLDSLPDGLAETVRTRLGFSTSTSDVLVSGERVADRWLVLGVVDQIDDALITRRVWLRGSSSSRPALVLTFAPPGRTMDNSLVPGTVVTGELAFYPGAQPMRALVGSREEEAVPAPCPSGATVSVALADFAAALAVDPWLERWPMVLSGVAPAMLDGAWMLVDSDGDALRLRPGADLWPLLAVSGGVPLTVAGEWSAAGLRPLSCWDGDRAVWL